jgi:mannose-6-phosphate isomerase-like protein (cupin superfamily)
MYKKIEKPWGYEELLEQNENYVMKRLFMKSGHKCSMQYHEMKKETFIVLKGVMKFYYGDTLETVKEFIYREGDYLTIDPKKVHRMEAIEDCLYLEASTNHLDDVVRLQDSYGR